jgi:N-acetylglucosamine-6-phosphate deacetylase
VTAPSAGRLLGVGSAVVDGALLAGDVRIGADGRVAEVGVPVDRPGDAVAVPGLVDLQVNGFAGVDLRRSDPDGYRVAGEALAAHAATAVQPTYFGLRLDRYVAALDVLAAVAADQAAALGRGEPWGCRFLPAHLEGPFLNVAFKGAHDERTFLAPSIEAADRLLATGQVGFMTVAPELPGGIELVRHLSDRGVLVSIGHSDADVDATLAAIGAGARHLTHCWNAHRRLTSRDPGPAAVALARPDLVVGLIPDGVHVADETVRLTLHSAAGRVAATTDCIPPAGLASLGTWEEEPGMTVTVRDGRATLADGTLAGSIATPDDVLRNLVGLGLDLTEAVDACGGVQRRLLGLDDVRLRPGDVADVAVLDGGLQPRRTLVAGHEVFAA